MNLRAYRVFFNNNKPVAASLLPWLNYKALVKLDNKPGKKRYMKWLVVVSENEKGAINMAVSILRTFWLKYLNGNK